MGYFAPAAFRILVKGQKPVMPAWVKFAPTKAVNQSQLIVVISICPLKWARPRLARINRPANVMVKPCAVIKPPNLVVEN